ncbi:MAG: NADH-quinone oxidoreductase subunit L [Bacteroidales bacterium]|jgi:NADH-quinone oxidoreductase subunit L
MIKLAWLIPLFPLAGFLITGLGNKRFPVKVNGWIASLAVLISFIISAGIFIEILNGAATENITLFNWISLGDLSFPAEFLVDRLSVFMLLIITGIGFLIHIYSIGYMHGDDGYNRFFSFMNLFIFFMTILVLGGSYLIMFIGWEGVGLCSYLLIGFWYRNQEYNNAAKKAFIMNRIGDLGFLLGMFLIFTTFGSLSYAAVFTGAEGMHHGSTVITGIALLLFAGAIGKSAQIPLLTWLPDAMAGPTPVSALIHAATMVTAGVYMVARSNIIYALSPAAMIVVATTGIVTALFAAIVALFQNDIKKVLAYSTISQLGLMFLGLGTGAFAAAMFHLMTHAFFKALLFLSAGSIIHSLGGEQDLRKMGGLKQSMPVTWLVFLTGALAISGVPPFAGFFSKDEILASLFSLNHALWILGLLISVMTAFYIFRIFYLSFTGTYRGQKNDFQKIHEAPKIMTIPLLILGFLSLAGGLTGLPEGIGKNRIGLFLEPVFSGSSAIFQRSLEPDISINYILMASAVIVILISIIAAWYLFVKNEKVPPADEFKVGRFENIVIHKFYLDELYKTAITDPVMKLSSFFHEMIDIKIIDRSVEWIGRFVVWTGGRIRLLQTGNVGFYLFAMVMGILAVLLFNIFI